MARLTLSADLQRHTDGQAKVAVSARNYRDLVRELRQRFPGLTDEVIALGPRVVGQAEYDTAVKQKAAGGAPLERALGLIEPGGG